MDEKAKSLYIEGIQLGIELRKLKIELCRKYSPLKAERVFAYTKDMFKLFENFYKLVR